MPKKIPLQGGEPVRGGDTSTITETVYSGKIPAGDMIALAKELCGLRHGSASLTITVRDGKYQYSRLSREFTRHGDRDE
jgi:hypothetical protein